jgi:alanine racemase
LTCSTERCRPTDGSAAVLTIDLRAIVANWRDLCARHPSGPVAAVLKADAYGTGAAEVAPALYAAGCRHFFVALLPEALALRPLLPGAMIAVLNGLLAGTAAEYAAHAIDPVLGSLDEVDCWAATARRAGHRLAALLHVDTGMARLGLDPAELATLRQDHARLDAIALRYVMTHLVSAERPDDALNRAQLARFDAACRGLPKARRSLANSSGLFLGPAWGSDLARPGAALYGINPTPGRPHPLRGVLRLVAPVLQVRSVQPGETVGYNATWRATRPSRIATVGVGYADGWPRALSNRGQACFEGTLLPLAGRVSMDLTTYDVTDHPGLAVGSWLELIGPGHPIDQVAAEAGMSAYELLTSLGRRYHRVWLA